VTTEVAPAASGRLSVANPLSGWGLRLIHHPSAVDCRASLRKAWLSGIYWWLAIQLSTSGRAFAAREEDSMMSQPGLEPG
jgi:hypothetical protein